MNRPESFLELRQRTFGASIWQQLANDESCVTKTVAGDIHPDDPHKENSFRIAPVPLLAFGRLKEIDADRFVDQYETFPHALLLAGRAVIAVATRPQVSRSQLTESIEDRMDRLGIEKAPPPFTIVSITPEGFTEVPLIADDPRSPKFRVTRDDLTPSLGFSDNTMSYSQADIRYRSGFTEIHDGRSTNGTILTAARGGAMSMIEIEAAQQQR
jgi:hypothetical protein